MKKDSGAHSFTGEMKLNFSSCKTREEMKAIEVANRHLKDGVIHSGEHMNIMEFYQ